MSKKIILTVVTIFTFVISNAQEKANHNTTRSNQTSGIMVKETGNSLDNDCDGVINSKLFVKTTSGTPDLNMHCCNGVKKSWEDATAQAVKEASKAHAKKHLFINNGTTYYYNGDLQKLNKCKAQLKKTQWIAIENDSSHDIEKRKKRNKNFNRKGERIKRTKF